MADRNRLKNLVRSLDCQNPDLKIIEAIEEILVEWGAGAYEEATSGNPSAFVFDTGASDQIHSWVVQFKRNIPASERQSIKDEILKLLE